MSDALIGSLATTDALAAAFADEAVLQAMLDVEVALARAEADAGMIPRSAVAPIARAARAEHFDAAAIAGNARESGTPAIALVAALTARVKADDAPAAEYVHLGATSQDVTDTALVLVLRRALDLIERDHARLAAALERLSDAHDRTVMLGRTLLQPATPVTFGLVAAGWRASIVRAWRRIAASRADALVLQFGGASGTLAALGGYAPAVVRALASHLDLPDPPAPWHAHRERQAALVTDLGVHAAALGKMARDISLLMQAEVGEVSEPGGGSSTMPHKRNPAGCGIVLAAATRTPGLVASYLTAMIQEHQRGLGGGHAEWPIVASIVQASGAATAAAAHVAETLTVHPDAMRQNLTRTRGTILAERAVLRLRTVVGKEAALSIVRDAVARTERDAMTFVQALREDARVPRLSDEEWVSFGRPDDYLGEAAALRKRLLDE